MDEQQFKTAFDAMDKFFTDLKNLSSANIFEIAALKSRFEEILKNFPVNEVTELKNLFSREIGELGDSIKKVDDLNKKRIEQEQNYQDKVKDLEDEIETLNSNLSVANDEDKEYLEEKSRIKKQELEDLKNQHQAEQDGTQYQHNLDIEMRERHRSEREKLAREEEENLKKLESEINAQREKTFNTIVGVLDKAATEFFGLIQTSISSVANVYEQSTSTYSILSKFLALTNLVRI